MKCKLWLFLMLTVNCEMSAPCELWVPVFELAATSVTFSPPASLFSKVFSFRKNCFPCIWWCKLKFPPAKNFTDIDISFAVIPSTWARVITLWVRAHLSVVPKSTWYQHHWCHQDQHHAAHKIFLKSTSFQHTRHFKSKLIYRYWRHVCLYIVECIEAQNQVWQCQT